MKAIYFPKYGSPDVLELREVPIPVPADNEILIKIHAASVNPLDWHRMRGEPFLAKLSEGLFKPRDPRLGADIAGRVEAVGSGVALFKLGDEVYGDVFTGGLAEYIAVAPDKLAAKPMNCSFEQAAAVPVAALTALQGLRDTGKIHSGQKVLVNGASGGVGSFGVQIAKAQGTHVTGVTSTRNLELVRSLGADQVIDYTKQDFTAPGQGYDLIFDAVGNRTVSELARVLKPDGTCVIAGFTRLGLLFQHMIVGPLNSRGGKKIGLMPTAHASRDDLLEMNKLLEARQVKPLIDRCYPLSETVEAIRYLEKGHARGKVIISML